MSRTRYNSYVKYLAQTFSYLKKSFWLPLVAMVIPAVLACFLSTPYWEVSCVAAFDYNPYRSASETFGILFGDSWMFVWPVVLIAAFQILGAAIVIAAVDMHFRTGRLTVRSPLRHINNTVAPIAIGVAVMSVFSILWRFLLFGLVMLVQACCGGMGFPAGVTLAVISVITVGMFVLHVLIITPVLFWAPIMIVYGYKFRDAAAMSYKLLAGKHVFVGLFLPLLLCAGLQLLVGLLQAHSAISITTSFVIFLFTNAYATVYTMVAFYTISELDRRDLKPYYDMPLPVIPKKHDASNASEQKKENKKSEIKQPDDAPTDESETENRQKPPKSSKTQKKQTQQKERKQKPRSEKRTADAGNESPRAHKAAEEEQKSKADADEAIAAEEGEHVV